jgi:hypothetical protein
VHERVLTAESSTRPAFKALAKENGIAWQRFVDEIFGRVDLSPRCFEEEAG